MIAITPMRGGPETSDVLTTKTKYKISELQNLSLFSIFITSTLYFDKLKQMTGPLA